LSSSALSKNDCGDADAQRCQSRSLPHEKTSSKKLVFELVGQFNGASGWRTRRSRRGCARAVGYAWSGCCACRRPKRFDPTSMTSHTFTFDEMERVFEVADKKLDDVVKVLITF
jgi:threonine dehydrogenase-like Zn-dependent dehydrogenase